MIEMSVLSAENPAVNPGDNKVSAKNLAADKSGSKGDFSKRLQKIKQKTDEGGDERDNIDTELENTQERTSASSTSVMPTDYINLTLTSSLETSMESGSGISAIATDDTNSLSALEAGLGSELLTNIDQTISVELEEVAALMEESTENKPGQIQLGLKGVQLPEQDVSPVIQVAVAKADIDVNTQKVQLTEAADIQPVSDKQVDADNGQKTTGLNLAQARGETGDDKNQIAESDTKAQNDQSDVKKLIDFEAHRMKASKLPAALEANNQEPGNDSQAMNDKAQVTDIKMAKTEVNFQDQLRTPLSPKEVIEQIVDKVELIQSKKMSELTLDLKPDFLGKMTIKLVMEEGGLTARFVTDSLHVKNLLESNLNSLKQTLESHGIKVEKTEVNVQLNNGGMFDGSEGNQQDRRQNQGYINQAWHYTEEILIEDELPANSEAGLLNYADTETINESMNFLV